MEEDCGCEDKTNFEDQSKDNFLNLIHNLRTVKENQAESYTLGEFPIYKEIEEKPETVGNRDKINKIIEDLENLKKQKI